MGLAGNLTTAQIVEQVVVARRLAHEEAVAAGRRLADKPLSNIVFMGMGEPLHNPRAVLPAVEVMTHPLGLHFSANKVTVSTVGLVPQLEAFVTASRAQLAVSLHATNDEVRDWIVPVNRRWPLAVLMGSLGRLFPRSLARGKKPRHVLFEYVMLAGVNDGVADAEELLTLTQHIEAKYNLIVFNPHAGTRFKGSSPEAVQAFRSVLIANGRVCTVRDSRGDDEMAACGQLGQLPPLDRQPPLFEPPPRLAVALKA